MSQSIIQQRPFLNTLPLSSEYKLLESFNKDYVFTVDGSRLYEVDRASAVVIADLLSKAQNNPEEYDFFNTLFASPASAQDRYIGTETLDPIPLYSLSLNVAQACNMACKYCYADEGKFGGASRLMKEEIAFASIDRLLTESAHGSVVLIGFMGGEPLLNKKVVHEATKYATKAAEAVGREVRFSITTNATLLTADDVLLFHEYPFTVQVSLDGQKSENDAQRPFHNGSGTYETVMEKLHLFQRVGRPLSLSARVTVTPRTGELLPILDHLIDLGFDDVGFAPVLVSPDPAYSFSSPDFITFLERMVVCAKKTIDQTIKGARYPFSNFFTALHEIHKGTHRPYPCGAGASYLSVNVTGDLYACHRLIDDPAFLMGNVREGSDLIARSALLTNNHVDKIEPCKTCWARYLCGGGCYHEVAKRGRVGCDYIRDWLRYCIETYADLSLNYPAQFGLN